MAEQKTKPTNVNPKDFIAKVTNEQRRKDAEVLLKLMEKATGWKAKMLGPSIVGFGIYAYTYDSGHSGNACVTGFSPRKANTVVYVDPQTPGREDMVRKLGKVKTGVACVYINKLSDIDLGALEKLVKAGVASTKSKWPVTPT
jgi:hypothetical protein